MLKQRELSDKTKHLRGNREEATTLKNSAELLTSSCEIFRRTLVFWTQRLKAFENDVIIALYLRLTHNLGTCIGEVG